MIGVIMISQEISFEEKNNNKYVYIYFVIKSPHLSPEVITSELGIKPSHAFAKGDRYLGKTLDPNTRETIKVWRERPWGIWRIDSKPLQHTHKKVEEHVKFLLDMLEPKKTKIEKYLSLSKKEYILFFNVNWRPFDDWGSYQISSGIIQRASMLCHYIEFALTNLP